MNKKGAGPIQNAIIAVIVVGMVASGIVAFAGDINEHYSGDLDTSKFASFNRISTVNNVSLAIGENIQAGSGEISPGGDIVEGQAKAGFEATKTLIDPITPIRDMLIDGYYLLTINGFIIPDPIVAGMIAIVVVIVVAGSVALIMKMNP